MNSTNSRLPSTVVWSAHDTYIPLVTNSANTYNAKHLIEANGLLEDLNFKLVSGNTIAAKLKMLKLKKKYGYTDH